MVSIVASVLLTIVLNVALRAFPGAGDRAARRMENWADADERRRPVAARRRPVKVFFPWKAALLASLVVTLLLNVAIRLG
jgi:hypothetical protein